MEKDSPAYTLTLFPFTDLSTKRWAEQTLVRWQAAKRRCRVGDDDDDDDEQLEIPDIEKLTPAIDNTVIMATSRSIACQTDLTLKHINDMESDCHQ